MMLPTLIAPSLAPGSYLCCAKAGVAASAAAIRASTSVPIPKFATALQHAPRRTSESKDTSKSMILVPLLNPKFATHPAAILGELRVRGTRRRGMAIVYLHGRDCRMQLLRDDITDDAPVV